MAADDAGAAAGPPAAGYEEFSMLGDNAAEAGLPFTGPPVVKREEVEVGDGGNVSALVWGKAPPELVLVHGGAQNAHTWDTVALAMGRPLVAVDLPGHGRSSWRKDRDYSPARNGEALAAAIDRLAPRAAAVVGMSLGGLSAICLGAGRPDLVRRLVLVDITPGVDDRKSAAIAAFIRGPQYFDSFEELLARTVAFNPSRSVESLRRGVVHNAEQLPGGRWRWRYDRVMPAEGGLDYRQLWDDLSALRMPVLLLVGAQSKVVDDADITEVARRLPQARVETVEGAGHSIQGDRPLELARLLEEFAFS